MFETPSISIPALSNKVKSCLIQGKYEEALEYIVEAEISNGIDDNTEQLILLYKIEGFIGISHFKDALELAKSITKRKISLSNYSIIIQAYIFEVEACRNLQLFDEAIIILETLKNIFKKLSTTIKTGTTELFAKYNFIKAHLNQSMGKTLESIKYYNESLEIVQNLNDRLFMQKILVNLSSAYWERGDLDQSHKLCMQALAIKTTEESYLTISKCLNLLGLIAQDRNNISTALNFYNQSLNLKYKLGNRIEIAKTLHSIGYVNKLLEKYAEALNALQESYNIFEELENYSEMSILQNDIGLLYLQQGNLSQAFKNFKQALNLSLKVKNDYQIARNYFSLSKIFLLKNDLENAHSNLKKCIALRKELDSKIELGEAHLQMGLIHFIENQTEYAIINIHDSEKCFREGKNKLLMVKAEMAKIFYYDQHKNKEKIIESLQYIKQQMDQNESKELRLLYILGEAIQLKYSKRLREKSKALFKFREVGHNLKMDVYFNEFSLLEELRLLFYEYSILPGMKILEDIKICINKLFNLADTNNQFLLKIYIYRIKAKLSLLLVGIDEAVAYMEEAFLFAQSKELTKIIPALQEEYEALDKKISYWNQFIKKRKFSYKNVEQTGILDLTYEIMKEKVIFYV